MFQMQYIYTLYTHILVLYIKTRKIVYNYNLQARPFGLFSACG